MSHYHPTREEEKAIHEELASQELGHEHHVHVTPYWPMLAVFVTLVIMTVVTVLTAKFIDLPGTGNLLLAMVIACFKGTLVFAYFMHLRYDKLLNTVVVAASVFAVVLFIGFSMLDLKARAAFNHEYEAGEITTGGMNRVVANANEIAREKALEHGHHGDEHGEHGDHADEHGDDAHTDGDHGADHGQDDDH